MDFFSVDVPAVVDDPYLWHNLLVLRLLQIVCSLKPMNVDAASTEVGVKSLERQARPSDQDFGTLPGPSPRRLPRRCSYSYW